MQDLLNKINSAIEQAGVCEIYIDDADFYVVQNNLMKLLNQGYTVQLVNKGTTKFYKVGMER